MGNESHEELVRAFHEELDTVFKRYNDLVVQSPAEISAVLINMADTFRDKFNLEITELERHNGHYAFKIEGRGQEMAALLGFERNQDTGAVADGAIPDGMELEPGGGDR